MKSKPTYASHSSKAKAYTTYSPSSVRSVSAIVFSVIAFSLLMWQRFIAAQAVSDFNSRLAQRLPANLHGNNPHYTIRFLGLMPCLLTTSIAYHYNSHALGLLATWPLCLTHSAKAIQLPTIIDFNNTLPSNLGFILQGAEANDYAGISVANAGDVNGDGITDFIVGAFQASPGGRGYAGAAYLIYGAANLPTAIDLYSLGATGVTIQGGAAGDYAGTSVARAGDVNGDGKADFIVGAVLASPGGRTNAGAAYLIYGAANLPATINLGSLGAAGVTIQGAVAGDQAGISVANAGDVNGDGITDFIVGAQYASPGGSTNAGAAYLIFGAANLPTIIDLASLGAAGITLQGAAAYDNAGRSVASAGDVNADGGMDFIVGAYQASPGGRGQAGAAYLIYGANNLPTTINLGSLGAAGVTLQGAAANDNAGRPVASAGDVNGDGKADFIVGAFQASPGGRTNAGAAYLIFGAANLPTIIDLASLGAAGVTLQGGAASDYAGRSAASAGDVNGDGKADFIVGAYQASPGGRTNAGAAYLIYGTANLPTTINLASLSTAGVTLQGGAENDQAGFSVASAGDVNGDGGMDIIVGAYTASPGGRSGAGAAYVVYGQTVSNQTSVTSTLSTSLSSKLTTTSTAKTTTTTTPTVTTSTPSTTTSSTTSGVTAQNISPTPIGDTTASITVTRTATTPSGSNVVTTANTAGGDTTLHSTDLSATMGTTAPASATSNDPVPIIAAAGGGFALAACLAAGIGIYACRKKSAANQATNPSLNKPDVALQNSQPGNYQQIPGAKLPNDYVNLAVSNPAEKSRYNDLPPIQAPYAGVKFAGQSDLDDMNSEVEQQNAQQQQAIHNNYEDLSAISANNAVPMHYQDGR